MKLVVCESCEAEFSIKHSMDDYYYRITYCTFCGIDLLDKLEDEIEWIDEDEGLNEN